MRQETLAGELRTPAFARLAAKAAAVVTAAVATAPEAPGAVRPVLASARTVTRTGYQATRVTGGSGWKTLLAGVLLVVIGVVLATQQMMVVGLTGTIIALVGAYLIALGAWGIHRGALGALVAITALAVPVLLTLSWVRTQLWGDGKDSTSGLGARGRRLAQPREVQGIRHERAMLADASGDATGGRLSPAASGPSHLGQPPQLLVTLGGAGADPDLPSSATRPDRRAQADYRRPVRTMPGRVAAITLGGLPGAEYEPAVVAWTPDGSSLPCVVRLPAGERGRPGDRPRRPALT